MVSIDFNWYPYIFHLVSICFTYLVSKFTIYFNWYQNIKYFLSLVSKCTSISISIGITYFLFHMVSKILWYLKLICWFKKNSKFVLFIYNWYLKILFMYKWYLKICSSIIKICVKNVLICIVYMQRELNISPIYRFMLSVSYIEEVDISSLCDTRV